MHLALANPRGDHAPRDKHDQRLPQRKIVSVRTQQRKKQGTRRTKRPYAHVISIHTTGTCSPEHNSKGLHNNGTPRPSFNDLMRPRRPNVSFFVLPLWFCVACHTCIHVTFHVALHPVICLVIKKEELTRICCEEAEQARHAKIRRIVSATTEESYDGSKSGFAEQSEVLVRCKRILRS